MAINLLKALQAITRQIPDKVTVGYQGRSSGDTFASSENFEARRQPRQSSDTNGRGRTVARWQLYATNGQTQKPARLGKITESGGTVWHVLSVTRRWNDPSAGDLIFDCDCVLAVA